MHPAAFASEYPGANRWPLVGRRDELERSAEALAGDVIRGLIFHGPAGVGKSRLAEEVVQQAAAAGRVVRRAAASSGASRLPLGALVHLLPTMVLDRGVDPIALYGEVSAEFRRLTGGPSLVLSMDDVHLLDPTSATLLSQLVDGGIVVLIVTARAGEPLSDPVASLLRREPALRFDLGDLSQESVDTMLHLALGGPVDVETAAGIWATSQGNALFVRELVLGARSAGRLVERRGVWSLTGPLVTTTRLRELTDERVGPVDGPARSVLDLLAVWEPVGLLDLEEIVGPQTLEGLEEAGLIAVRADARRQHVTLAHPLYAEALRDRLPALTMRRLLLEQCDRIERHGARRRDDPLRLATARLDASGAADPDLLVAAARLARYAHDHPTVVRLAGAALTERPSGEGALLLAEALHELGSYVEAEQVLADAEGRVPPVDELLAALLTSMRVRNLVFGLHRPADALAMVRAAQDRCSRVDIRNDLIADEGIVLLYWNRPEEVLQALSRVGDTDNARTRVLCSLSEATALTLTGRCETALQVAQRSLLEHRALGEQVAIAHADIHHVFRMHALTEAGRLDDARAVASAGYRGASRGGPPLGRIWFATGLGRAAILAGEPRTARHWLTLAAAACQGAGFEGPLRGILSLLATAAAWTGAADEAVAAVAELDELVSFGHSRSEEEIGRAWAAVAMGQPERARRVLRIAAEEAAVTGHRAAEAWLLHDVARLGEPRSVSDRLQVLAGTCEGALVSAYAAHARALAAQHPGELLEASEGFEAMGAALLAAEAATAAGAAYRRAGEPRRTNAALGRAAVLLQRCEGARTPGLVTAGEAVALSAREREVAVLAAADLPSKEIAERLYLSIRTVHNHLQNIYTKLGVSGRSELDAALRESDDR